MGRAGRGDQALTATGVAARLGGRGLVRLDWDFVCVLAFAVGAAWVVVFPIVEPGIIGSHALIYTEAARAWLTGGDPWSVGPPLAMFAGPPPMLLPFAPFAFLPAEVTRWVWVGATAALAFWIVRKLGLPLYWLAFPPLLGNVILGHPEVLMLGLLVVGGVQSGLAAIVKPYAALALLAEKRGTALILAAAVIAITAPLLPWARFLDQLPEISATLARQARGDTAFGDPLLMVVTILALAVLGPRRALWLATPVLWPAAQPGYKVISMPMLPRIAAAFWAIPVAGATIAGVVVLAALVVADRRRPLPGWLRPAIEPVGRVPTTAEARG